jgi:hypothetical protein
LTRDVAVKEGVISHIPISAGGSGDSIGVKKVRIARTLGEAQNSPVFIENSNRTETVGDINITSLDRDKIRRKQGGAGGHVPLPQPVPRQAKDLDQGRIRIGHKNFA